MNRGRLQCWRLYADEIKRATSDRSEDCNDDRQRGQSFDQQGASITPAQDLQSPALGYKDPVLADSAQPFGFQKPKHRVEIGRCLLIFKDIKWDKILVLKNAKRTVVYCTAIIRRAINKLFNIK